MQLRLRTQRLQRLQDHLKSEGKVITTKLKLQISELPTQLVLLFCSGQNF